MQLDIGTPPHPGPDPRTRKSAGPRRKSDETARYVEYILVPVHAVSSAISHISICLINQHFMSENTLFFSAPPARTATENEVNMHAEGGYYRDPRQRIEEAVAEEEQKREGQSDGEW